MKDGGWGRIVNFGSGSVFQGTAVQSHYAAAICARPAQPVGMRHCR